MPEAINKVRYLIIGNPAPPNSRFKGTITADTIFGSDMSVFNYSTRYAKEESDKDFDYESIFDYAGRYSDNKTNFTMSSEGKLDTKEKIQSFIDNGKVALNEEGQILWEFVFSPKDIETSDKYHLSNQSDYAAVISRIMPDYLKRCGFNPNNVSWWQDYHPENRTSIEPHPHIHIYFFENNQERTRGKLKQKDLNLFKRLMANEMLKRQDKSQYREIFNSVNLNKRKILEYSKKFNLSEVESVKDLYRVLPSSGRLQYNSANMIPYRKAIDRVVNEILNSDECKDAWDSFQKSLSQYEELTNRINGGNLSLRKQTETKKLKVEIANYILSEKKNFIEENSYERMTTDSSGRRYSYGAIQRNMNSRGQNPVKIKRFINGMVAQRQREIDDEIEEFLKDIQKGYGY